MGMRFPLYLVLVVISTMITTLTMFWKPLLHFFLDPSTPVFHSIYIKAFSKQGLTASLDMDIAFPRLRFLKFLTITLDECEHHPSFKQLEASLSFVNRGIHIQETSSDSFHESISTVELIHVTLSEPLSFSSHSSPVLQIRQENIQLSIQNESSLISLIKAILDSPQSDRHDMDEKAVLQLSIRGTLTLFNSFTVLDGVFPAITIDLKQLLDLKSLLQSSTSPQTEHIDIYQSPSPSESPDPQPPILSRPPGFTGILPGITLHSDPIDTSFLQLHVSSSLKFTFPPALDLRIHSISFGVYLNRKQITSGLLSTFHLSHTSRHTSFLITLNNPQTLSSLNPTSLLLDITGLLSRSLGLGIGAIETVVNETISLTTGLSVKSSRVGIKVLQVQAYDCLGGVVDVEWLGKVLGGLDDGMGGDFAVFGGGGGRALSPPPPLA
ncbi:hypothetical protein HDU98_002417 [Podochytrium sp. JEL0797]|nr:hypothetical protein HDU98_002417 [Podochytrium sp. JEL0797]